MTKIVKHSAAYILLGFLPVAVNFLLAPVYTSVMDPEEYALVGLGTLFQSFLTFFITLSLDGALSRIYFNYKFPQERADLLSTLLITIVISTAIVLSFFLVSGNYLFSFFFTNETFTFSQFGIWVFLSTFSTAVYMLFVCFLRNQENVKAFSLWSILFFIAPVIGTLIGLFIFKAGAKGALAGRGMATLLVALVMLILFFRKHRIAFKRRYWRESLKFSLPLIPYQLMFVAFSNIDRIFLERRFTAHEFGVYNFAAMVSGLVPVFINALSNSLNPQIFKELKLSDDPESVIKFNRISILSTSFVICIGIACVVPAMRLFIRKEYMDAYPYAGLLILSYLPYIHYVIFNVPLLFHAKTRSLPVISVFSLLAGLVFIYTMLPLIGIWAVCFSLFIIRGMQLLVAWVFIRHFKFNRFRYTQQHQMIAISAALIASYSFFLYLSIRWQIVPVDIVNLLPVLMLLFLSIIFYRQEISAIRKHLRGIIQKPRLKRR